MWHFGRGILIYSPRSRLTFRKVKIYHTINIFKAQCALFSITSLIVCLFLLLQVPSRYWCCWTAKIPYFTSSGHTSIVQYVVHTPKHQNQSRARTVSNNLLWNEYNEHYEQWNIYILLFYRDQLYWQSIEAVYCHVHSASNDTSVDCDLEAIPNWASSGHLRRRSMADQITKSMSSDSGI